MTTVVAAVDDEGRVHLAADTLTNVYERPIHGGARKLIRIPFRDRGGHAAIGCSGDGALPHILTARLTIVAGPTDPRDPDAVQAWAHQIATDCTQLAVGAGLVSDGRIDATMLLAGAGRLWTIMHGGALRHPDGRAAIGSGEGPAIGALDALIDLGLHPGEAVVRACRYGIHRDKHSGGPVQSETVEPLTQPAPRAAGLPG